MGNVCKRGFREVDPKASLLILLARAFHFQALALLLCFQADQIDPRMNHYIFFPAILLTIKTTINKVIHVSCSLTYCICRIFSSRLPPCVKNATFFYPFLSQPLTRVNSDKHKHGNIALISAENLIYWQLNLLE